MVVGDAIPLVWERYGVGATFEEHEWRAGGRWTAAFLFQELKAGEMQLWLVLEDREAIKAALVTDIRPYRNGFQTCLVVMIVGKEPRSWIKLRHVLEDWARRSGCEKIEVAGRLGWKRVIPDWEPTAIILEKRL